MGTKRIGIVVDDYKVERYVTEIKKLDYTPIVKQGITRRTNTIVIEVSPIEYDEAHEKIRRLCKRLEHTKGSTEN